jgi:hypothetical protein
VAVEIHDPEQAPIVGGHRRILRFPRVASGFCESVDTLAHGVPICQRKGDFSRLAKGIVPQNQQIVERWIVFRSNIPARKGELG